MISDDARWLSAHFHANIGTYAAIGYFTFMHAGDRAERRGFRRSAMFLRECAAYAHYGAVILHAEASRKGWRP